MLPQHTSRNPCWRRLQWQWQDIECSDLIPKSVPCPNGGWPSQVVTNFDCHCFPLLVMICILLILLILLILFAYCWYHFPSRLRLASYWHYWCWWWLVRASTCFALLSLFRHKIRKSVPKIDGKVDVWIKSTNSYSKGWKWPNAAIIQICHGLDIPSS